MKQEVVLQEEIWQKRPDRQYGVSARKMHDRRCTDRMGNGKRWRRLGKKEWRNPLEENDERRGRDAENGASDRWASSQISQKCTSHLWDLPARTLLLRSPGR